MFWIGNKKNVVIPNDVQQIFLGLCVRGKHRRDGMSRLASSRNVQWSAEGATNSIISWAHNLVNLSSLTSKNSDERTTKMSE